MRAVFTLLAACAPVSATPSTAPTPGYAAASNHFNFSRDLLQIFSNSDKPTLLASYSPVSGAVILNAQGCIAGLLLGEERYISFDANGASWRLSCACTVSLMMCCSGAPVRDVPMHDPMPSIVVTLSAHVTFVIEGPTRILFKVRMEDKTYVINVATSSRKRLYRPTSDTVAAHETQELNHLKGQVSRLLSKMRAVVSTATNVFEPKENSPVC